MWRVIQSLLFATLLAVPVQAQQASADDIRKLDDRIQEVKTEVLDIAAEVRQLEEQLLYPSETRLTVALAMTAERGLRPGTAMIRVDGNLVAHHVYSDSEVDALRQGGVQSLYVGNVTIGKHEIDVTIRGSLANGDSFEETGRHEFNKGVDAKTLDITLTEARRDIGRIRIEDR